MLPSRLTIIAGTYDGVLVGWDTAKRRDEELLPSSDDDDGKQKKKMSLLHGRSNITKSNNDGQHLKLSFAMSAHSGSVRCTDIASSAAASAKTSKTATKHQKKDTPSPSSDPAPPLPSPGMLLTGGYDETINVYNLQQNKQVGELKTPSDLGSPLCCSFAPPSNSVQHAFSESTTASATHALVGLTSGKIILYKRRDWSVQHVLSGHDDNGVQCLAVHPTGRMALSGGRSDGKIILWDLMKGRLAFVHKITSSTLGGGNNTRPQRAIGSGNVRRTSVNHIIWSTDGTRYAYCYGNKITARDVDGGETLLDVELPSRVNQIAFIGGPEGMFVAAACDDGGLPVLEVGKLLLDDDDEDEDGGVTADASRRAIMAIEPVEGIVAGDDRFKCIQSVEGGSGFLVVTANSGGVVSLMDLEGAARMMLTPENENDEDSKEDTSESDDNGSDEEDSKNDEVEAAVEIIDSVRIGSGARITDLAVWSYGGEGNDALFDSETEHEVDEEEETKDSDIVDRDDESVEAPKEEEVDGPPKKKRKGSSIKKENRKVMSNQIELDAEAVERARKLVGQAKKHQKKKRKGKKKQMDVKST